MLSVWLPDVAILIPEIHRPRASIQARPASRLKGNSEIQDRSGGAFQPSSRSKHQRRGGRAAAPSLALPKSASRPASAPASPFGKRGSRAFESLPVGLQTFDLDHSRGSGGDPTRESFGNLLSLSELCYIMILSLGNPGPPVSATNRFPSNPARLPAARGALRSAKAERERRVVAGLSSGVAMAEIARREGMTVQGLGKYVRTLIARRAPGRPASSSRCSSAASTRLCSSASTRGRAPTSPRSTGW